MGERVRTINRSCWGAGCRRRPRRRVHWKGAGLDVWILSCWLHTWVLRPKTWSVIVEVEKL